MSKTTKAQLAQENAQLKTRVEELTNQLKLAANDNERHAEWMIARATHRQPKNVLINVGFKVSKKGKLIGTGWIGDIELNKEGKPEFKTINGSNGNPLFGFVEEDTKLKLVEWAMYLLKYDQVPDAYVAKVHGDKSKSKVEQALS